MARFELELDHHRRMRALCDSVPLKLASSNAAATCRADCRKAIASVNGLIQTSARGHSNFTETSEKIPPSKTCQRGLPDTTEATPTAGLGDVLAFGLERLPVASKRTEEDITREKRQLQSDH